MVFRSRRGFTIVELLIVIVVIGILAAITVVAYNGIQQRAQNTQRVTAAKDWQKLITAYTSSTTSYPTSNSIPYHDCLGSGYETSWDGNSDEDCGWSNNIKHPSSATNTAFATIGTLPNYPKTRQTLSSTIFTAGISIRASETLVDATNGNKANYPTLLYWLNGNNQDCGLRPVTIPVSGGIGLSSAINSGNDGFLTQCRIALPDPSSL
jgi:prepilin-type N-terminal cleavage/methylation domain-containing protein